MSRRPPELALSARFNVPNTLTWIRIGLIPLFVIVFWSPYDWARPVCAIIFSLAGITDWLDGYFARRLNQTSAFGAFLDPVADKLMVSTALVLLVAAHPRATVAVAAAVIIGREIAVSGLREWMSELGARQHVAVSAVGKFKTIAQITALIMMLYEHDLWLVPMFDIGYGFLLVAAVLTLWSMSKYLAAAWPHLRGR
jgi:CDP-diacylglycerol--glycerol-3-phosphate 3-phosphatidyltransferase/cardiolipin synthase